MHPSPAQLENLGRGLEGDEKGRLLAGLGGEDRQALLSWGHDLQGLHLPSPTGGLLEVDLQHILQLGAIQHIGDVEHQHCLRHWLGLDLQKESEMSKGS